MIDYRQLKIPEINRDNLEDISIRLGKSDTTDKSRAHRAIGPKRPSIRGVEIGVEIGVTSAILRYSCYHFGDMARKLRVEVEGGLYHLIARSNDRQDIFHSRQGRHCQGGADTDRVRARCGRQ